MNTHDCAADPNLLEKLRNEVTKSTTAMYMAIYVTPKSSQR